MKKSKIMVIFFMILTLISISCKAYAYTTSEIKDIVNYREVDEKPEGAVEIDASDLISDEKIPVIQASLESVLYGSDDGSVDLTDINFLVNNSTNTNSAWLKIQGVVTTFYKVCLYLAAIIMITTLIYIAIILILESYHPDSMPKGARMFRDPNGGNPEQEIRKKALFEQWITSILLIALITVIINLVVNFTDSFSNIVSGYKLSESSITVYVDEGYAFDTTIEGLILFESQYNWADYASKNVLFIVGGILVTVFKYFVYFLFVIRMFLIAILVTIAPIVIVINAYLKISRKKGIFRIWLTSFLFLALIKPVIAILYYILGANDLLQTFPLYIIFVITVETIAIILSIMFFKKGLNNANKAEQREYDEIHGKEPATTTRARMMQQVNGGISYADVVEELRERAGNSKAMSDYLDSAFPKKNAIDRKLNSDRTKFVEKVKEAGLGSENIDNAKIIPVIKGDSNNKWRNEFGKVY